MIQRAVFPKRKTALRIVGCAWSRGMAPARPGLFDFDDTLPARIVLLDTDLVHPAPGVDRFHPCGVESLADIVVPDPQRGRP